MREQRTREDGRIVLWEPQDGPQTALVTCEVEDVFYGGARGGGKTDGLLGDFLFHAGRYGENAHGILFRRTIPELDKVIARSKEIYFKLGWTYKEQKHDWIAPNGATLALRYLDRDADAEGYQGHEYTWLGFDELPHWPSPVPIDKLWGTLRSAQGVPCVRRSTGNPGGPGHAWVKKRYIDNGPYRIVNWTPNEDRPDLTIQSVFIPARLEDNRILVENDPSYEAKLAAAGSKELFRAWRSGDWNVLAGQYFDCFSRLRHVKRRGVEYTVEPWHTKWISMDWGYEDKTVVLWHRLDEDKKAATYRELVVNHLTPDKIGRRIVEMTPDGEKIAKFWLSPDAFHKRTSERTIADEIGAALGGRIPKPEKANDDRVGGWSLLYQLLASDSWIIDEGCVELAESLPLLVRDTDKNPEDCAASTVDHAPDAARYGMKTQLRTGFQSLVEKRAAEIAKIEDVTSRNMQFMRLEAEQSRKGVAVRARRYHH